MPDLHDFPEAIKRFNLPLDSLRFASHVSFGNPPIKKYQFEVEFS
jgi:hypothetical protein